MTNFDLNFVREQFYAFDADNPLSEKAFFENAGGSFPCKFVVDKLTKFYQTTKVTVQKCPGRSSEKRLRHKWPQRSRPHFIEHRSPFWRSLVGTP